MLSKSAPQVFAAKVRQFADRTLLRQSTCMLARSGTRSYFRLRESFGCHLVMDEVGVRKQPSLLFHRTNEPVYSLFRSSFGISHFSSSRKRNRAHPFPRSHRSAPTLYLKKDRSRGVDPSGIEPTVEAWNQRINLLIDQHRFNDALEVYYLMKEDFVVQPNEETHKLISPCINFTAKGNSSSINQSLKRKNMKAVDLKNDKSRGLDDIDIVEPFNEKISGLIDQNRYNDAIELFDKMQENLSLTPSEDTYEIFICLFVMARDKEKFMKFYKSMESANVKLTSDTLHSDIIEGIAMEPVDVELLLHEWQNGISSGLKLSKRGYVFLVSVISQRRDLISEHMPKIAEEVFENNFVDSNLYSRMITANAKTGYWERSRDIFQRMNEKGIAPDIDVCNAVLQAYSVVGRWQGCMELFEEMLINGVNPNHTSFIHLLYGLNRANQWEKAVTVLKQSSSYGVKPSSVCYNIAMQVCARAKQGDIVVELMKEMLAQDFELYPSHFAKTIRACDSANMPDVTEKLYQLRDERKQQKRMNKRETDNEKENKNENDDGIHRTHGIG
mmetsp:Transcript_33602/g.41303  ORF Transcript_33602/g.41303 Transcript_33602/m.41303 type:complete len:556 (+) Transcript_33602:193-1860(+)